MADADTADADADGSQQPDVRERVRRALEAEGFKWELWQKPERGQEFGMIRREGDMQLHVRYYEDDVVKAERELANDYVEHLLSPRVSAHDEVEQILVKHGLDDVVDVEEKRFPDRHDGVPMPGTRTRWKPLVLGAGVALASAVAGLGMFSGGE
jgi:hypothetical protein